MQHAQNSNQNILDIFKIDSKIFHRFTNKMYTYYVMLYAYVWVCVCVYDCECLKYEMVKMYYTPHYNIN